MNGRIVDMVVGALFLYVAYLKLMSYGLNYLLLVPMHTFYALCFAGIGIMILMGRQHVAVYGLAVVALFLSLNDLNFFSSYSLVPILNGFTSRPFVMVSDIVMPIAAIYWNWKGGFY